jgi:hypothetical protein
MQRVFKREAQGCFGDEGLRIESSIAYLGPPVVLYHLMMRVGFAGIVRMSSNALYDVRMMILSPFIYILIKKDGSAIHGACRIFVGHPVFLANDMEL